MAVTIRDVAALAGVSPSTVSRTCRNSSSISLKTQEKVRQAMAQLGYEPPAGAMAQQETGLRTVGIILPSSRTSSFENPFFLEVLRGITRLCNEKKVLTALITGKDDAELLDSVQANARNRLVNAWIVLFSREDDPVVDYLYDEGIDYVQIGQPSSHPNETVAVDNDNIAAGQEAARYLTGLGHRTFAFVGSDPRHRFSTARCSGVRLQLQEQGLDLRPAAVAQVDVDNPRALEIMEAALFPKTGPRPTAVVAADEMHAVLVRHICQEKGLEIPRDLSLISFNNSIVSTIVSPALTSIDINARQLGIEAALQAIKHLDNPDLMPSRTLVPFQLIERESCQATSDTEQTSA